MPEIASQLMQSVAYTALSVRIASGWNVLTQRCYGYTTFPKTRIRDALDP